MYNDRNDENTILEPVIKIPKDSSVLQKAWKVILINVIFIIAFPYLLYILIRKWSIIYDIFIKANKKSIQYSLEYKNKDLIKKAWMLPSARFYYNILEYQLMEGYCSCTTQRCILKSIENIDLFTIPIIKRGPSTIANFSKSLDQHSNGKTHSTIILGNQNYELYLEAIKKSNDLNYRVSINFLRSSLFGFKTPIWLPSNLLIGMFGGHFSPILGYFEEENLVVIFDVNHNYGLYFVSPQRLYESIATYDISSNECRGIILTKLNNL